MNERQRDLFLYLWHERRKPGLAAISLRGLIIGALGGLAFAILMMSQIGGDRGSYTGISVIIPLLANAAKLLVLSVPAFGFIGWMGARRVFLSQEAMYQSMLAQGAQVPAQKPSMQAGDRGPAVAVAIAVAVIAGFIITLFVMYG